MDKELDISRYFSLSDCKFSFLWEEGGSIFSPLLLLESYFSKHSLGKIEGLVSPSVHLENPDLISIGTGTTVEAGAYIQGPCVIGENCRIRSAAYIRENVLIADHCVVGHGTEIKHSILLSHAHAAHFSYVGNSILGSHVNLGAGVKCANFRLDGKEVVFFCGGKKIATGTNKMGAIIGDRTQIGCNTVLGPATFVGRDSLCYPLLSLRGIIPPMSIVKNEDRLLVSSKRNLSS
jgi:UDP-N-acetylglucosamine diphosphorylase / glucose-1-phosphate thymidylyltransferase / UDP-N-acetylgalactosamine diphosphorylase / glucosamine-1-phosphate N-acetyltransferase / galactosamine-1-phosphate N-acetyltransferase